VAAQTRYHELFVDVLALDDRTLPALADIAAPVTVGLVSNFPCGASLRRSLSALGVAPERVLFVGDSWASDTVGGHAAAMATCHHRGMIAAQDCERSYATYRPDSTIEHLAQLSEILALA
jgi:predicted HAD superfamily phosphohydrolase YqeG